MLYSGAPVPFTGEGFVSRSAKMPRLMADHARQNHQWPERAHLPELAAISACGRGADIDFFAAIARCTTRKSVHHLTERHHETKAHHHAKPIPPPIGLSVTVAH